MFLESMMIFAELNFQSEKSMEGQLVKSIISALIDVGCTHGAGAF